MAPFSGSIKQVHAGQAGFLCLPDELIVDVLRRVDLGTRLGVVPRICKRLSALAATPCTLWDTFQLVEFDEDSNMAALQLTFPIASRQGRYDLHFLAGLSRLLHLEHLDITLHDRHYDWETYDYPPERPSEQHSDLPDELCTFTRLKSLRLSGGSIGAVPQSISGLVSLQSLTLDCCGASYLPTDSLGKLSGLHTVRLTEERYGDVALKAAGVPSVGQLTSLQHLTLSRTHLRHKLPEDITALTGLRALELSILGLASIPECVGEFTMLTRLCVRNDRRVFILPSTFTRLINLVELDLHGMQQVLPDIGHLPQLQQLHVTDYIDPAGIQMLELPPALRTVHAPGNARLQLTDGIRALPSLSLLDLSANMLSDLPDGLDLRGLTCFEARGNDFARVPDALRLATAVQRLDLSLNERLSLHTADVQLLLGLPHLKELCISKAPCGTWDAQSLKSLPEPHAGCVRKHIKVDFSDQTAVKRCLVCLGYCKHYHDRNITDCTDYIDDY
ncbi:hypothetical protein WJX72_011373 [[Myrmecia] bisecta]|uniref:F-box domain-containing protein n=1 Tax=[Myrmecia] bisecta TaxID=41462 RepID=A0AAW1P739_9CHLO